MFYYSDQYQDAVFNTAEPNIIGESSQNGALAVNEKEQLIALSVNGGVAVYSYKMKEGIPSVTEKFRKEIAEMGGYVNDFEFDYAGNLYLHGLVSLPENRLYYIFRPFRLYFEQIS